MKSFSTQKLFNLNFFSSKKEDLYLLIKEHLEKKSGLLTIATPNPEQIIQSQDNSDFLHALQQFEVLLPDGQGVIWASRVLNTPISERIPGVEVVEWMLAQSENIGPILIVGGRYREVQGSGFRVQGLRKDESSKLKELVIHERKVFWTEGYGDIKNPTETEENQVEVVIKKLKPSVILVALGAPWQEQWVIQHKRVLDQNAVNVVMVVGGAIDMILGKVKRAPDFIQKLQLEWLFRLIQEPWRWKRQLRLIKFVWLVVKS